jgi:elongation factor P
MKINANELRKGNVIEQEGNLYAILEATHVSPGKGSAFVQVVMRNVKTGLKKDDKFRSGESVERVRIDEEDLQFLFADDTNLTFMNPETYDQLLVPAELLGEKVAFLQDGMICRVALYEGQGISVQLPQHVVLELVEADPVVKGQTASSSYKPGKLENGLRIMIPPHVEAGIKLVVATEDCSYVERFKG